MGRKRLPLADVSTYPPDEGDVLVWKESLDAAAWVPFEELLADYGGGGGGGATTLDALTDVVITTPATGSVLTYDGTQWADAPLPAPGASALDDLSDVVITTPATNAVLTFNGTAWVDAALPPAGTDLSAIGEYRTSLGWGTPGWRNDADEDGWIGLATAGYGASIAVGRGPDQDDYVLFGAQGSVTGFEAYRGGAAHVSANVFNSYAVFEVQAVVDQTSPLLDLKDENGTTVFSLSQDGTSVGFAGFDYATELQPYFGKREPSGYGSLPTFYDPASTDWDDAGWAYVRYRNEGAQFIAGRTDGADYAMLSVSDLGGSHVAQVDTEAYDNAGALGAEGGIYTIVADDGSSAYSEVWLWNTPGGSLYLHSGDDAQFLRMKEVLAQPTPLIELKDDAGEPFFEVWGNAGGPPSGALHMRRDTGSGYPAMAMQFVGSDPQLAYIWTYGSNGSASLVSREDRSSIEVAAEDADQTYALLKVMNYNYEDFLRAAQNPSVNTSADHGNGFLMESQADAAVVDHIWFLSAKHTSGGTRVQWSQDVYSDDDGYSYGEMSLDVGDPDDAYRFFDVFADPDFGQFQLRAGPNQSGSPVLRMRDFDNNDQITFASDGVYPSVDFGGNVSNGGTINFKGGGFLQGDIYSYDELGVTPVTVFESMNRMDLNATVEGIMFGARSTAPTDAHIGFAKANGGSSAEWTAWVDAATNKLKFRVLYPDGTTFKTGEVALA